MKTWLITGCSSGIGKGIAKAVLESGDQAIVTRSEERRVGKECRSLSRNGFSCFFRCM